MVLGYTPGIASSPSCCCIVVAAAHSLHHLLVELLHPLVYLLLPSGSTMHMCVKCFLNFTCVEFQPSKPCVDAVKRYRLSWCDWWRQPFRVGGKVELPLASLCPLGIACLLPSWSSSFIWLRGLIPTWLVHRFEPKCLVSWRPPCMVHMWHS